MENAREMLIRRREDAESLGGSAEIATEELDEAIAALTRPTADLGEDLAAMLYQEAGQLDDPARANAIREAADRLILYRKALEAYVAAHDAWIEKDAGINAAIHAADAVVKASNNARAVLSRSGS